MKFIKGDIIQFKTDDKHIPDFEAESDMVIHGSTMFKENKGIVVGEYEGRYVVSYIDRHNAEVVLEFKPKDLILIESNSTNYEIY